MRKLSLKDIEDLYINIFDGKIQMNLYNYFQQQLYYHIYYDQPVVTKDTLFDHVILEFENCQINDLKFENQNQEITLLKHIIISTFDLYQSEQIKSLTKIAFKNECELFLEDIGFYFDDYKRNLLDNRDIGEILKFTMQYYGKAYKLLKWQMKGNTYETNS